MKSFVVVPTFNESRNIARLLQEILELNLADLHVLVVDDHSPDGTSDIVAAIAARDPRVIIAERFDKGRGTAGIVGFHLALELGAERIVEMDADFSHPPKDIPRLLEALGDADIAIASRLLPGSEDVRPQLRRMISIFANEYTRLFLERPFHKSKVMDWTTGFRAYRRSVFEKVPPSTLISTGPSILQEVLFRALNQGLTAREITFRMVDRAEGVSTFSGKVARQSLLSIPAYRLLFGSKDRCAVEFRLSRYNIEKPAAGHYQFKL